MTAVAKTRRFHDG